MGALREVVRDDEHEWGGVVSAALSNPYERANRAEKTTALVLAVVAEALVEHRPNLLGELADTMARWSDVEWTRLAVVLAGVKPPSPETRGEVVRLLREHAAASAKRREASR